MHTLYFRVLRLPDDVISQFFSNTYALFPFPGCALATESEWQWQAGKQYAFEYSGRLLTGIPQLASHYSGLGITATVLIDALSPTQLQLSVTNARFVR